MSWSAFDTFTDPDAYHAAISAYPRSRSENALGFNVPSSILTRADEVID